MVRVLGRVFGNPITNMSPCFQSHQTYSHKNSQTHIQQLCPNPTHFNTNILCHKSINISRYFSGVPYKSYSLKHNENRQLINNSRNEKWRDTHKNDEVLLSSNPKLQLYSLNICVNNDNKIRKECTELKTNEIFYMNNNLNFDCFNLNNEDLFNHKNRIRMENSINLTLRFLNPLKSICTSSSTLNRSSSFLILNRITRSHKIQYRGMKTISPEIVKISGLEMKRQLKQKGIPVADGFTALMVQCLLCTTEEKGNMFINKTTGYFSCATCDASGEWPLLERAINFGVGDKSVVEGVSKARTECEKIRKSWREVKKSTTPLSKLDQSDLERLFALFEWPYHKETWSILSDVRCNAERNTVYFPLACGGKELGWRELRAGDTSHGSRTARPALYTCRALRQHRSDQAILVPSVSDLLHLAKDRVPGLLVWWYGGALPPAVLPVLESFNRIVVWGAAEHIRGIGDKLGDARCRFVRPIQGATTATEVAEAASAAGVLRAAVTQAAPAAHRSITNFRALRDDVYANLTNAEKVRGVKWTRFPALSKLLGGHRRGELTIITGATGCGKTTLTAEMSLDLATSGVNTLWGSFEIRNSRLAQTMLQQHAGVPLEENLQHFDTFADEFEKLPIYFLAFHGAQPIQLVMEAVEHARYVHDIAHVIVDNVQFMLGVGGGADAGSGTPGERFFRQDAVIAAFRTFASRRDCHVTLVMHPRKERDAEELSTSSIFGSAKASQEADNVLIIQDKRLTAIRGKKYLQVAKNRYSGDLGIVPLEFDKAALSHRAKRKARDGDSDQRADSQARAGRREDGHKQETSSGADSSFLGEILHVTKDK